MNQETYFIRMMVVVLVNGRRSEVSDNFPPSSYFDVSDKNV